MDQRRVWWHREMPECPGPVVCWMSRDQRAQDNWALLFAQETAVRCRQPLCVVYSLDSGDPHATLRHTEFMLRGLEEVEQTLRRFRIPFFLLEGPPDRRIPGFVRGCGGGLVVGDFSPLRNHREWTGGILAGTPVPFCRVDAHNIVPCWLASAKKEYAAHTFRPKLRRLLPEFLEEFPPLRPHPVPWAGPVDPVDWTAVRGRVRPVDRPVPGETGARTVMEAFLHSGLERYGAERNDPLKGAVSGLSPYLHFGQIAPQRVALAVQAAPADPDAKDSFLEELIVRRELADNFCYYEPSYDRTDGFPAWARETLRSHRPDPRPYRYEREQLEGAGTHEALWNACQRDLMANGRLHGYLRMYWAKKILEWSLSPEEAMESAVFLNDRYALDGGDPNGYAGIAWSIGGVHDRPWPQREIFGKIRYMNEKGCRRKFDVEAYMGSV